MAQHWWTEFSKEDTFRVGWLGVLRRSIRLETGPANRLTIPVFRQGNPANARLVQGDFVGEPQSLAVYGKVFPGTQIAPMRESTFTLEGGTVALDPVSPDTASNSTSRTAVAAPRSGNSASRSTAPSVAPNQSQSLRKRLAQLLQPPLDLLLPHCPGILEWPASLFNYQLQGVQALVSQKALLLADDMGLGKTIQAVAALRILMIQRRIETALVVSRAGLLSQWRAEFHRWAPELMVSIVRGLPDERARQWNKPAHIYLVGYETFRADFTDNPHSPPRRRVWGTVVLDEAQAIKNRETEISNKCKRLARERAWALTGTPVENREDDLASILEFTTPLNVGDMPRRLFPGADLYAKQRQLQLRRRKRDVLPQLPPKTISRVALDLEDAQRRSYDRAEREGIVHLRELGEQVRVENVLELILRLKQICNFCPESRQSSKLNDLLERLATLRAEGNRALVFTQYTDATFGAHALTQALADFRPLLYSGDLSALEKEHVLAEFKGNPDHTLIVLSLRAGGQGLNLQEASYVFHFDRWWNPAVEHQAEDRSHRLGQLLPVNVYQYVCEGTIEERIEQILRDKQLLFDQLVEGVSLDLRTALNAEELFGLFGIKAPARLTKDEYRSPFYGDYARMSGEEFELHVRALLESNGWKVESTPASHDGGIDLVARKSDAVNVETVLYIQCKKYAAPVGVDRVRELNGALPRNAPGALAVLVCPSGFTSDAVTFARKCGILLWDRVHLTRLASGR